MADGRRRTIMANDRGSPTPPTPVRKPIPRQNDALWQRFRNEANALVHHPSHHSPLPLAPRCPVTQRITWSNTDLQPRHLFREAVADLVMPSGFVWSWPLPPCCPTKATRGRGHKRHTSSVPRRPSEPPRCIAGGRGNHGDVKRGRRATSTSAANVTTSDNDCWVFHRPSSHKRCASDAIEIARVP